MRRKKALSVFLAVLCFVFTCCPFLAYGATDFTNSTVQMITVGSTKTEQGVGKLPYGYTASFTQDDLQYINLFFSGDLFEAKKDDVIDVTVQMYNGRYTDMNITAYLYHFDDETNKGSSVLRVTGDYNTSTDVITATFSPDRDYTNLYVVVTCSGFKYASGTDMSNKAYVRVESGFVQITDAEQGFWASVVDWFQQIFDSITEGFDNIGDWFSDLGNKISSGFTDMVNNVSSFFTKLGNDLRGWFEDVGDWFSNLGSTISGWFTDLFDWFDEQLQAVQDWWESVKQWFHDLFVPEDGYFEDWKQQWQDWFEDHFGAVYQSVEIIDTLVSAIFAVPTSSIDYIEYPSLTVPVADITFLEGGKFYWDDILTNQFFETVFTMFRGVCTVLAIWAVIMFAKKTLDDVLGARDV